jgi:hypothetical protein
MISAVADGAQRRRGFSARKVIMGRPDKPGDDDLGDGD